MKNDEYSTPSRTGFSVGINGHQKKYDIRIDENDPSAAYKIFYFTKGIWTPVCRFNPLCDVQAREIRELLDKAQG